MPDLSHRFGSQEVTPEERERRIGELFRRVAPRYDLMNDLMSLGVHRLWKRALVWAVDPRPGQYVVDLAGGTGDVAKRLLGSESLVVVCDPSRSMMAAGRKRGRGREPLWVAGAGERLPFADASVDTVTIAFGMRNVTYPDLALREVLRVLRPGGRFLCLEFSRPLAWLRPFYGLYSRLVIPRLGAWVAGDTQAYHYLVESIRTFADQQEVKGWFEQAGFEEVSYRNLSFGIACIHVGSRPSP